VLGALNGYSREKVFSTISVVDLHFAKNAMLHGTRIWNKQRRSASSVRIS
jgi:hypothetical protein